MAGMVGLEDPSISEFVHHPSDRQIATFFLGFVFITCIHFTFHIPLAALRRIRSYFLDHRASPRGSVGLDTNHSSRNQHADGWLGSNQSFHNHTSISSIPAHPPTHNLALSLTICFALASVAQFGSLLAFDRQHGLAACAFLVAWGGMAAQSARLLGLLKLSLDLKKLRVNTWETHLFWGWLLLAIAAMFVSNAISIGTVRSLPDPQSQLVLCYRKHFLPTAVVSSAINVILEIYTLFRIYYLVAPPFLSPSHKFDALLDVRAIRALSLLILDLATAVPAAQFISILVDFVPGSLATLLVLVAFNQKSPDVSLASTASIPSSRPESVLSRSTIEIKKMPSNRSLTLAPQRISHPFAASALQDPSPETEDWPASISPDPEKQPYLQVPGLTTVPRGKRRTWRTSNQSAISESDSDVARSVKGAVVGFAFKDMIGSSRRQRDRGGFFSTGAAYQTRADLVFPPTTPLRVPRPIFPARTGHIEALEQASRYETTYDKSSSTATSGSHVAVSSGSTPSSPAQQPPPALRSSTSSKPTVSIKVPSSNVSTKSSASASLHLTPITPGHSQRSIQHASSSLESEWRYESGQEDPAVSAATSSSPTQQQNLNFSTTPQRLSGGSARLPPADDDLSIVYEASHEGSEGLPPSRAYRPTFGEHMFVEGGIGRITTSPQGVPEDVREGGRSNGSQSSKNSRKPSA